VRNELWRRAQAVPSLDLRFAENKSLTDAVTGQSLITFTRASSATYIDSAGTLQTAAVDVPRFDHNPTTGESLGLLVEEQRTNLLLRSEEFDNASWNPPAPSIATVTPNAQIAPNGTLTADTFATVSGTPAIFQAVACLASTAYTWSFYVKLGTMAAADFRFAVRDDTNGAFIAADIAPSITPVTTEWRRVTYTFTTPVGCVLVRPYPYRFSPATYGTTVHLWGAQLEAGAFPTSYILNVSTPLGVTRNADVASITTVGSNIRSLFAQFRSPASGTRPVVSLDDNTANERIEILTSGTDPKLLVTDGGSAVADLNGGTVTANVTARAAAAFDTNNYAFSVNGGASQLDSSGTLPTVNRIRIGSNQAGGYLNGTIARATGWDVALPNLPPITQ
jgi:hypothetical protein